MKKYYSQYSNSSEAVNVCSIFQIQIFLRLLLLNNAFRQHSAAADKTETKLAIFSSVRCTEWLGYFLVNHLITTDSKLNLMAPGQLLLDCPENEVLRIVEIQSNT